MDIIVAVAILLSLLEIFNVIVWRIVNDGKWPFNWRVFLGPKVYFNWLIDHENKP